MYLSMPMAAQSLPILGTCAVNDKKITLKFPLSSVSFDLPEAPTAGVGGVLGGVFGWGVCGVVGGVSVGWWVGCLWGGGWGVCGVVGGVFVGWWVGCLWGGG